MLTGNPRGGCRAGYPHKHVNFSSASPPTYSGGGLFWIIESTTTEGQQVMNTTALTELGVPENFNLAPGCSRTPPAMHEPRNGFEDHMALNQKRYHNMGQLDWMAWADES